jgi:hypothetical protein
MEGSLTVPVTGGAAVILSREAKDLKMRGSGWNAVVFNATWEA